MERSLCGINPQRAPPTPLTPAASSTPTGYTTTHPRTSNTYSARSTTTTSPP
nr:MAG TPA: hypothetical protein [Caudoviricetes sp.]